MSKGWFWGASLLATALAAGVVHAQGSAAAPSAVESYQQRPEIPLNERLGLWDPQTQSFVVQSFEQLRAKLANAQQLNIMCHGWAPGFRTSVDANPGLRGWDPALRDVNGAPVSPWFAPMAAALQQANPSAVILAYSWIDESATPEAGFTSVFEAHQSLSRTDANGARVVQAIAAMLPASWREQGGKIHILGHSHGARVATVAASLLNPPPEHLTVFDAPENGATQIVGAADQLDQIFSKRLGAVIGRQPGQLFVDNYYSYFGKPYGLGVLDVKLKSGSGGGSGLSGLVDNVVKEHAYPLDWYTKAITTGQPVGLAWSPVIGQLNPATLSPAYLQAWAASVLGVDPAEEFTLTPTQGPSTPRPQTAAALQTGKASTQGNVTPADNGVYLDARDGQPLSTSRFTLGEGATSLAFQYEWVDIGAGDELAVYINGQPRFFMEGRLIKPRNTPAVGLQQSFIDVSDLGPGEHSLTVVLHRARGTATGAKQGPPPPPPPPPPPLPVSYNSGAVREPVEPVDDFPRPNNGIAKTFVGGFEVISEPPYTAEELAAAERPIGPALNPPASPTFGLCGTTGLSGALAPLAVAGLWLARARRRAARTRA